MKRTIIILLAVISVACIAVSLILPLIFASDNPAIGIIGGADAPT